jgi:hypothetical protein
MSPRLLLVHLSISVSIMLAGCVAVDQSPGGSQSEYWNPPSLEADAEMPEARDVVKRMIEFMGGHDEMSAEVLLTYQAIQESGQRLHFDYVQRVAVSRSQSRMLWKTLRDDGSSDMGWIANGEFVLVKQPANLYARLEGPDSIQEMAEMLAVDYEIDVPLEDIVTGTARSWSGDEVVEMIYVGEAFVKGRWTDHVAIRKADVDVELWIRKGDEPYPARIVAIHTGIEGNPGWVMEFRTISNTLPPAETLDVEIPEDAERVEIVPVVE